MQYSAEAMDMKTKMATERERESYTSESSEDSDNARGTLDVACDRLKIDCGISDYYIIVSSEFTAVVSTIHSGVLAILCRYTSICFTLSNLAAVDVA